MCLSGDLSLCPASQVQFANRYGDILAQYGNSCYTVANTKVSWGHAYDLCQMHSGHLLHILNKDENDFITNLLSSQFSHSVWIGLHDINREEHFKWTSGELAFSKFMCGPRGGQGVWTPPPLKNRKNIGFLSNFGPDPLKNRGATKPAFNVGPPSARQQNAI